MLDTFLQWLLKFVPKVPEDIAVCEFECRKTECLMGHWAQCERRLRTVSEVKEQRPH